MKTIACVNFRGGAGKTTITWMLAKYLAERENKRALVVDIDAQMSLTLAVQMEDPNGALNPKFEQWDRQRKQNQKTLVSAIESFENTKSDNLNFAINSLIYKFSGNLHLIPSSLSLYWLEFDSTNKEKIKSFIPALIEKMSKGNILKYDYILFDCPPNFTALTYSVLDSASIILIPVNPDAFTQKTLCLMIKGLSQRLNSVADPNIKVFMNKAKTRGQGYLTPESKNFLNELNRVKHDLGLCGTKIKVLESYIPESEYMKESLSSEKFPNEYIEYFQALWRDIIEVKDIVL